MGSKKHSTSSFFYGGEAADVPTFGSGEAAVILDIPIWRLQKFLDSRQYHLSPTGAIGYGRGSRRTFTLEDLSRIALANFLVKDGFSAQFIGSVLQELEDNQLRFYMDDQGEECPLGVAFYRGKDGPIVRTYRARTAPPLGQKNSPYYRIDFDDVFTPLDKRIAELRKLG